MTKIFKILFFISSYSPLYLIVAILTVPYKNFGIENIVQNKVLLGLFVVLATLTILSTVPIVFIQTCKCNNTLDSGKVTQKHEAVLSYLITYIVPLIAIDIEKPSTLITNAILFLVIGILYVKSNMMHINITFLIFGWNIYEDENKRIIISKEKPDYFARMKLGNRRIHVRKLATNIYIHKDNT